MGQPPPEGAIPVLSVLRVEGEELKVLTDDLVGEDEELSFVVLQQLCFWEEAKDCVAEFGVGHDFTISEQLLLVKQFLLILAVVTVGPFFRVGLVGEVEDSVAFGTCCVHGLHNTGGGAFCQQENLFQKPLDREPKPPYSEGMSKRDAYQAVTDRVLALIDEGVAPWRKPWADQMPRSMSTGKTYRGINLFLLDSGWWGTYKKIAEMGGQVRKGEKGSVAVFWRFIDSTDADGNEKKIPLLRYYRVFRHTQADWADGMPEKFSQSNLPGTDNERIVAAEQIVTTYRKSENAPRFDAEGWDRACYIPSTDAIQIPALEQFEASEHYYSTMFHEMGHSTGAASRLNREGVTDTVMFGSHRYAREELVAEMTAAMLMGQCGIEDATIESSAAYLKHWRDQIEADPRLIVKAAGEAQRAADHILGVTWDD